MAPESTALTRTVEHGSPYQLDTRQTLRAAQTLVKHIQAESKRIEDSATKKSLLADASFTLEDQDAEDEVPVWLVMTTKKFVSDKKRLKPGKIALPHSLNASPSLRICLITADPQRTYKDLIAHAGFPTELSSRIGRVIGITKLKARYKSYESKRQLASEYDVFLADDRIITYLPAVLGKTFYKGGAKRPVPVSLSRRHEKEKDVEGRTVKKADSKDNILKPDTAATEIEKALSAALINISPSATTAVKVALANWSPEWVQANVEAVVTGMVDKFVPKGWKNVRSIHIKGPNTIALPIWLASELWVEEGDVVEQRPQALNAKSELKNKKDKKTSTKAIEPVKEVEKERKRKAEDRDAPTAQKKSKKDMTDDLAKEIAVRKEKLRKQRAIVEQ